MPQTKTETTIDKDTHINRLIYTILNYVPGLHFEIKCLPIMLRKEFI